MEDVWLSSVLQIVTTVAAILYLLLRRLPQHERRTASRDNQLTEVVQGFVAVERRNHNALLALRAKVDELQGTIRRDHNEVVERLVSMPASVWSQRPMAHRRGNGREVDRQDSPPSNESTPSESDSVVPQVLRRILQS